MLTYSLPTVGVLTLVVAGLSLGCSRGQAPAPDRSPTAPVPTGGAAVVEAKAAALGQPAPNFELPTLAGGKQSLAQHKGKIVVLEWFNADCPFVKQGHTNGELKGLAARLAEKDVVWLAINSSAAGKQGHGADVNKAGKERYGLSHPILFDENGKVGRLYGAERTPHMYVIDAAGVLVYRGAIDNLNGGDAEDVDKVENYVVAAIADVQAGKPVARPETEAYGCSVKYARK